MKMLLYSTIAVSAVCAIAAFTSDDQPKFEAASVKRMDRGVIYNSMGPATVVLRGDPLKIILMEAFKVKADQIVARIPEGASNDQIPAMLQGLLAERFKLAAHKDARPRRAYALVVDKGGPKFKEADTTFRRFGPRPGTMIFRASTSTQGFKGAMTMSTLAHFLAGHLDRPVQDLTGLGGEYDIDFAWAPDPSIDRPLSPASLSALSGDGSGDLPAAPTANLFTAIRESLGLKLEARIAPVDILVIDHIERIPTGN